MALNADVINLYKGIEWQHGADVIELGEKRSAASATLISPAGLPIEVGWFDNRYHPCYALTTHPLSPNNILDRIMIEQQPHSHSSVLLEFDDSTASPEYGFYPEIDRKERLDDVATDLHIRGIVLGSYLLNTMVADKLNEFAGKNRSKIDEIKNLGKSLISQGDYVEEISAARLRLLVLVGTVSKLPGQDFMR